MSAKLQPPLRHTHVCSHAARKDFLTSCLGKNRRFDRALRLVAAGLACSGKTRARQGQDVLSALRAAVPGLFLRAFLSELHRQDDHLQALQVQASLQYQRRLVVQQAGEPVVVFEDQLAGEVDGVGKVLVDFFA